MITIISSFNHELMNEPMIYLLNNVLKIKDYQIVYDQILQELTSEQSLFKKNKNGINVIVFRLSDFYHPQKDHKFNQLKKNVGEVLIATKILVKELTFPLTIIISPIQVTLDKKRLCILEEIRKKTVSCLQEISNVQVISEEMIQQLYPTKTIHNPVAEKQGHVPYTREYFAAMSFALARKINSYISKRYKVIVLDCDNTLWKGLVGEDGIDKIKIDARSQYLQQFMIKQQEQGLLLCLCSKNNEKDIIEVFNQRKDMLLNLSSHIVTYRINWKSKSENIRSLAKELKLGLESFIFIDDDPTECAEVKIRVPEVLTIQLPNDHADTVRKLQSVWAFDDIKTNQDSMNRTALYKDEYKRLQARETTVTFEDFIKSLQLEITTKSITDNELPRVAELTERTNQFNLHPEKLSPSNIENLINQDYQCMVTRAKDKFGDYGIVGVMIIKINKNILKVRAFLLSCRAINKGIEYEMMNFLSNFCLRHKLEEIAFQYTSTEKNIPAQFFIRHLKSELKAFDRNHEIIVLSRLLRTEKISPKEYLPVKKLVKTNQDPSHHMANRINRYQVIVDQINSVNDLLEKIDQKNSHSSNRDLNAQNEIEEELIKISKSLNCLPLTRYHSFMGAGLDSLKALEFIHRLYERFGIEINYNDLLQEHSSIATIGAKLETYRGKVFSDKSEKNSQEERHVPLSFYQNSLWVDEKISQHPHNISIGIKLSGTLAVTDLEHAFINLFQRHDVFRMKICVDNNGEVFQQLLNHDEIVFSVEIIKNLKTKNQVNSYFTEFSKRPFQLDKPPLFRVSLLYLDTEQYILCVCIHHIIHDAQSLNIIFDELSQIYNAYRSGHRDILENLPIQKYQYSDFIHWQRTRVEQDKEHSFNYWKQLLNHIHDVRFINDFSVSKKSNCPSKRVQFDLGKVLSKNLITLSKNENVTLYNLLLSAYIILISKYCDNAEDIPVVVPVSIRDKPNFNNLVGLLVNLNVLRFIFDGNQNFSTLLQRCKKIILDSYEHYDFPFELIGGAVNFPRNANHKVLFGAGFVYQNYASPMINFSGLKSEIVLPHKNNLLYDCHAECRFSHLTVYLRNVNGNIQGIVEYNKSLFKKSTILYFIQHFSALLENIVKNPQEKISDLSLIDSKEINTLLQFGRGPVNKPKNYWGLIDYFKEQVIKRPEKIALKDNAKSLTYLEVDNYSTALAESIKATYNPQPATRIALCMEKSSLQIISILAILKLFCTYVPLDLLYAAEGRKVRGILKTSNSQLLLVDTSAFGKLFHSNPSIDILNVEDINLYQTVTQRINLYENPQDLAYIIFTSGSTGQPKGIMIEQRSIIRLIKNTHHIEIDHSDVIAQASNISFDASTLEIWGALLNGATLTFCKEDTLLDVNLLSKFLKFESISILWLTAELFHRYAFLQPSIFSSLKYLLVGGDVVNPRAINKILKPLYKPLHVINGYGPSENTTFSTSYEIKTYQRHSSIPIGKPIDGTNLYIVEDRPDDLKLVPIGIPGKLYVSGIGLMRGYLEGPQKSGKEFIPNPFIKNYADEIDHQWLYDTGDYARWDDKGNVEYLGRKDSQVKIRGFRINLQQIENLIATHPHIAQTVALVRKTEMGDKQIIVFFSTKLDKNLSADELSQYFQSHFFSFIRPKFYIKIDEFPITTNRKIDRKKLLEKVSTYINCPEQTNELSKTEVLNETEEQLRNIYSHILGINNSTINVHINFFNLGGSSLSAISLLHLIEKQWQIKIPYQDLFRASSIKKLSIIITKLRNKQDTARSPLFYNNIPVVKLKEGKDNRVALVFIHPIGGTVFCYQPLINSLETACPCYAIQDPSIHEHRLVFTGVEEMAKNYSAVLQKTLPNCSYILCGYSFGGIVSLEMAHFLTGKVPLIFLFDAWVVSRMSNEQKRILKSLILKKFKQFKRNFIENSDVDPGPWLKLYYHRMQHLGFSFQPHRIGTLNTRVVLFKATELTKEFLNINDPTNYVQSGCVNPVIIHEIAANHDTILDSRPAQSISIHMKQHINTLMNKVHHSRDIFDSSMYNSDRVLPLDKIV